MDYSILGKLIYGEGIRAGIAESKKVRREQRKKEIKQVNTQPDPETKQLINKLKFAIVAYRKSVNARDDRSMFVAKEWMDVYSDVTEELQDEYGYDMIDIVNMMSFIEREEGRSLP